MFCSLQEPGHSDCVGVFSHSYTVVQNFSTYWVMAGSVSPAIQVSGQPTTQPQDTGQPQPNDLTTQPQPTEDTALNTTALIKAHGENCL